MTVSSKQAAAEADTFVTEELHGVPATLLKDEGAAPAAEFTPAEIRHNFKTIILLDCIYWTGSEELGLAMTPLWVFLNANMKTVGIIEGLGWLGLVGIFVSPWISRRFHVKKWYLFWAQVPFLLPLAAIALGIIFARNFGLAASSLLGFIIAMLVLRQFLSGFLSLPQQEYIAACIPMSHRGRYAGLSYSLGTLASLSATAVGFVILADVSKPLCFGVMILMTWIICQGGYLLSLLAREKPVPHAGTPRPWSAHMFQAAWDNKPYVRVLAARAVAKLTFYPGIMGIMYYGLKDLKMAAATVAVAALCKHIALITTGAPTGWLIDRWGGKRVLTLLPLGAAVVFTAAVLVPGTLAVYVAGTLATLFMSNTWSAGNVLLYGVPRPEHRAGHYTIQLVLDAVIPPIGLFLGGWMFDVIPFRAGFCLMLALSLLMFPVMKWLLDPLSDDPKAYA